MNRLPSMTDSELRDAYRARCLEWLAADKADNHISMFVQASITAMILIEQESRLRGQAKRERPVLHVVGGRDA